MRSHHNLGAELNQRLLRLFLWAILMATALIVTAHFNLGRTIWVPVIFLPFMVPIIFFPVRNTENTDGAIRFWRFAVWVCLMCISCLVTMEVDLRKTVFVPMVFLPLFVPMVLMPLKRARKTGAQA